MKKLTLIFVLAFFFFNSLLLAQEKEVIDRLKDLDQYMENVLSDWNAPGIGIGIIYKDRLKSHQTQNYLQQPQSDFLSMKENSNGINLLKIMCLH